MDQVWWDMREEVVLGAWGTEYDYNQETTAADKTECYVVNQHGMANACKAHKIQWVATIIWPHWCSPNRQRVPFNNTTYNRADSSISCYMNY